VSASACTQHAYLSWAVEQSDGIVRRWPSRVYRMRHSPCASFAASSTISMSSGRVSSIAARIGTKINISDGLARHSVKQRTAALVFSHFPLPHSPLHCLHNGLRMAAAAISYHAYHAAPRAACIRPPARCCAYRTRICSFCALLPFLRCRTHGMAAISAA